MSLKNGVLQVESTRETLESIRTFSNFENKRSERTYEVVHFLGYLDSFNKHITVSLEANIAAYGSGRGASCQRPGYQLRQNGPPGKYERWLSGASTGPVGIGYYNRPDELILACRKLVEDCVTERKANKDYRLEEVLECLCLKGREWVRHKDGRPHYLRRNDLEPMAKGWYDFVCKSILPTINRSELTVVRAVLIHSIIIGENINVEEIIANQFYKVVYKTDLSSSLPFPGIIAALSLDAKVTTLKDDTLINQELPIVGEAMIYRRLDSQQEESRKSFEAINQRMDQMDDQLSFLCYSNQMVNETMYFPYQNTARQFKEMETQGIPVTIANLAIHRHREEEINQERMRHDQEVQEVTNARAREVNKGKARDVVPDSEEEEEDSEELYSSASEEWKEAWVSKSGSALSLDNLSQLVRDCRLNTYSKEPPCNRAFKVKKNP
ncbi:hypothetical protein PIB30_068287 [Stylosanthes scabra]|uniref:Putative plant transposon protein domain-containing protein n=1 Tax=Stylosanthes scabra TaxID=79078 RepID=A0ABU6TML9_9FABA|nr:hypothetical protein [Stylosanthes scabra]